MRSVAGPTSPAAPTSFCPTARGSGRATPTGDQDLFLRGVVRWLGYPLASVPYRQSVRQHGDSKYSIRRMVELAVTGIAVHSVRPLRFAIWLALGFAALGALFVIYSIVSFLFVQHT